MSCDLTTSLNFIVLIKFMVEELPRRVPIIYSSFCYSFIFNLNVIARCSVSLFYFGGYLVMHVPVVWSKLYII